jgi:serine/threonine protein kinase
MESRPVVEPNQTPLPITDFILPYAHAKVRLDDLQPDGRLISYEDAEMMINYERERRDSLILQMNPGETALHKLSKQFAHRYKKGELNPSYSIIVFDDEYYAVYRGVKQECHLGSGGFGYVKLVQNLRSAEWAVIKITAGKKEDDYEYAILTKLNLGIGQLERLAGKGSAYVSEQIKMHPWYWQPRQNNLVMKMAEGMTLDDICANYGEMQDSVRLHIAVAVLKAYAHLEKMKVIHTDLKGSNIFYDFVTDKATIIDYGASKKKPLIGQAKGGLVYTLGFNAPEIKADKKQRSYHYTKESDMYALGKTLIYFFSKDNEEESCRAISDIALRKDLEHYCRLEMCHTKPAHRPVIAEAIDYFSRKYHSTLSVLPCSMVKVGLLDVNEYLASVVAMRSVSVQAEMIVRPGGAFNTVRGGLANMFTRLFSRYQAVDAEAQALQAQHEVNANITKTHAALIQTLKTFDQLWLVDTTKRTDKEYIALHRELHEAGVRMGNRCIVSTEVNAGERSKDIINYIRHQVLQKVNKYYFVTTNASAEQLAQDHGQSFCLLSVNNLTNIDVISKRVADFLSNDVEEEYQLIINSLESLKMHRSSRVSQDQALSIEVGKAIADLQQCHADHKLSYEYVAERLSKLKHSIAFIESHLSSLNMAQSVHTLFSKHTHDLKSHSHQVDNIEEQYKLWVKSYQ